MFTRPWDEVIATLRVIQYQVCCYGTTEGDGRTCDCKFGKDESSSPIGEQTGCPELRQVIRTLEILIEENP